MMKINFTIGMIALAALFLVGCGGGVDSGDDTGGQVDTGTTGTSEGRLVSTITDAAADMGSIKEIHVTVESVRAHSEAQGWVTLSSETKTYDLLELKAQGKQELYADAKVKADTYDQLRLDISNVIVVDNEGEHDAKLPSGKLQMKADVLVKANETSTAEFDFQADESLHITGNGRYILAPVVELETRNDAEVNTKAGGTVNIQRGNLNTKTRVGMDTNGNVGVNTKIPANAKLKIGSAGKIETGAKGDTDLDIDGKGNIKVGITDAAADMESINSVEVQVDSIRAKAEGGNWVTLSTKDMAFDLLELKDEDKIEFAAESEVDAGKYTQVRLDISNVIVVDNEGEHDAKLPSGNLYIMADFYVEDNKDTAITLDFQADESLHMTGEGRYILAPVVQLRARERVSVSVEGDNEMKISGGRVRSKIMAGMDMDGNVKADYKIPQDAKLRIDSAGNIIAEAGASAKADVGAGN